MEAIDIDSLSAEERLELLEQVWQSLSETPLAIPLMNAQCGELDRRLDDLDRDGPAGIPWKKYLTGFAIAPVKPVLVRPAAAADIEEAYRWYKRQSAELADRFLVAVQSAVDDIVAHPNMYPVVHRNTRRVFVRRFPYGVFYRLYGEVVVVIAYMHGRRDPLRWKSRA